MQVRANQSIRAKKQRSSFPVKLSLQNGFDEYLTLIATNSFFRQKEMRE